MKIQKPIAILFTAHIVSGLAQGVSLLAVPWYFAKQGFSSQYNFYYGILTLFIVFWGLYAGTLVDRYSRVKVFVITNLIEFGILGFVSLLGFLHLSLNNETIFLVLGATFLGFNIHYPNMYAFLQEMTLEEDYPKVSSIIEVVGQSTSIISGALASLLLDGATFEVFAFGKVVIARWSLWEIFALDACTYLISAFLILSINYKPLREREIEKAALSERLKSGFVFLKKNLKIFALGILPYSVFACVMVQIYTLLPIYVKENLQKGGAVFASCDLIFAVGALVAGIGANRYLKTSNALVALPFFMILTVVAYFIAFLTQSVYVFYFVCFLFGLSNSSTRIARISYLLASVPNFVLGRVNSVFLVCNILERSLFIFLFSLPFFYGKQIVWAYFVLGVFVSFNIVAFIAVNYFDRRKI